ncbi:MAG: hypothetical protein NTU98_08480 [Bacteroidetes bacterium]|nr:hypothetical protein [Bacteroidota bacterium]
MKTVKFNEEEVELLIAIYEDELKEAEIYMDKLTQTLGKLKKQAEIAVRESAPAGKKRGRKPKKQLQAPKPAKQGKKRGRKKKVVVASLPEPVKAEKKKKVIKKKRARKPAKRVVSKPAVQKATKVEAPAPAEEKQG